MEIPRAQDWTYLFSGIYQKLHAAAYKSYRCSQYGSLCDFFFVRGTGDANKAEISVNYVIVKICKISLCQFYSDCQTIIMLTCTIRTAHFFLRMISFGLNG